MNTKSVSSSAILQFRQSTARSVSCSGKEGCSSLDETLPPSYSDVVFTRSASHLSGSLHTPSVTSDAHNDQLAYHGRSARTRTSTLCCRITFVVLLTFILGCAVVGCIFMFGLPFFNAALGSQRQNESTTKVTGGLHVEFSDHTNTLSPSFSYSTISSSSDLGDTKQQQCLKHCFDKTYLACPCNHECICPPSKKTPSNDNTIDFFKNPIDFINSFIGDKSHIPAKNDASDNQASELCIAICGGRRSVRVDCEKLLYACD